MSDDPSRMGMEKRPPSSISDLAKSAASTVGDEATKIATAAKSEAADVLNAVKAEALDVADKQKEAAVSGLNAFAGAVRKASDDLKSNDQTVVSQFLGHAAEGLESAARSFGSTEPGQLLAQVREFARNNPSMFIAGSVLAGLALGRFIRSSDSHESAQASNSAVDPKGASGAKDEPGKRSTASAARTG